MRLPLMPCILLLMPILCCQHSESRYLPRNVVPNEVIGTWVLTPTGVEGLRYVGHTKHLTATDHLLDIQPGGSCFYRGFIEASETRGVDEGYVAVQCEWTLGNIGHQALLLHLKDEAASNPHLYFDEEDGKLLLWQHVDDPDAWKYVEFMKQTQ